MLKTTFIGLESTSNGYNGASVLLSGKKVALTRLFSVHPENDHVKPLDIGHPIVTSPLDGKDILVRYLSLPVTKDKDIAEALPFQIEPLLPFPIEEAVLTYQILSKEQDRSHLSVLITRKESLENHLNQWKTLNIEPEKVSCVQAALCSFGNHYFHSVNTYLIFHFQRQGLTCVMIKEDKIFASFTLAESIDALFAAQMKDGLKALPQNLLEWQSLGQQNHSHLAAALKKLQKEVIKLGFALTKEAKVDEIEGIYITGEAANYEGLSECLISGLSFPLLPFEGDGGFTSPELLASAVPIGLALGSLPGNSSIIDFRQQEWAYPHPWKRVLKPLAIYFSAIIFLSFAFYFFSQQYFHYQEDKLKETYIDLLGSMHKSHEQFEKDFLAKNKQAHDDFDGEVPLIQQIQKNHLRERLAFLEKGLQSTPDSFPLFANTPRVSDVLAWLSQHPAIVATDDNGNVETRLHIDHLNYTMEKRPQQGKKQEKYQIKIELELSSPTPKWAREFHDALIAPNDWVDPKGEVKWNANRGKYKTSFYLKDKTVYPNL